MPFSLPAEQRNSRWTRVAARQPQPVSHTHRQEAELLDTPTHFGLGRTSTSCRLHLQTRKYCTTLCCDSHDRETSHALATDHVCAPWILRALSRWISRSFTAHFDKNGHHLRMVYYDPSRYPSCTPRTRSTYTPSCTPLSDNCAE